ncbi:MAG: hypothetical protein ACJA1A_002556 [Saprospiraceae bacterium]|jgi:hypothetical protein
MKYGGSKPVGLGPFFIRMNSDSESESCLVSSYEGGGSCRLYWNSSYFDRIFSGLSMKFKGIDPDNPQPKRRLSKILNLISEIDSE